MALQQQPLDLGTYREDSPIPLISSARLSTGEAQTKKTRPDIPVGFPGLGVGGPLLRFFISLFFLAFFFSVLTTPPRKLVPNFTEFFGVLPGLTDLTEFYWVLPGFAEFYQVSRRTFTEFYRVFPSSTWFYRVLTDFTGFYRSFKTNLVPCFTEFYVVLPSFTGFYRILLGFAGF